MLPSLILAGGPPRSGTTFLAQTLNRHPRVCAISNNVVFESDALFNYNTGDGLISRLAAADFDGPAARSYLESRLVRRDPLGSPALVDVATSATVARFPRRPTDPETHTVPAEFMSDRGIRLCLKSPQIVGHLGRLAALFPEARFVVVFRHPIETAGSMYRMAETVWPDSYHRLWESRARVDAGHVPPVRPDLRGLWPAASGFQKCLLHTVSLLRRLLDDCGRVTGERLFLYDHQMLIDEPRELLVRLAAFLDLDPAGFDEVLPSIQASRRDPPADQRAEYRALDEAIDASRIYDELTRIARTASRQLVCQGPRG